jgi:hypothetical protein
MPSVGGASRKLSDTSYMYVAWDPSRELELPFHGGALRRQTTRFARFPPGKFWASPLVQGAACRPVRPCVARKQSVRGAANSRVAVLGGTP